MENRFVYVVNVNEIRRSSDDEEIREDWQFVRAFTDKSAALQWFKTLHAKQCDDVRFYKINESGHYLDAEIRLDVSKDELENMGLDRLERTVKLSSVSINDYIPDEYNPIEDVWEALYC